MKLSIRGLSVLFIILSFIGYLVLQEPITTVSLDDYSQLQNNEIEFHSEEKGTLLYIYSKEKNKVIDIQFDSFVELTFNTSVRNDYHQMFIEPIDTTTTDYIKFHNFTAYYYPSFEKYDVLGSIEFDKGDYIITNFLDNGDYIISSNLPVETNKLYSNYSYIPMISGGTSLLVMFLTLLSFGGDYNSDRYQQGYKKPQRGKKERY